MKHDYKKLPITKVVVKNSFEEEELNDNSFLKDILEGRISLEDRMERIPKFNYKMKHNRFKSTYNGSTIDELRRIWKEGTLVVEKNVESSKVSLLWERIKEYTSGILFDEVTEVVIEEEMSLEAKLESALKELRTMRRDEKASLSQLGGARDSLNDYLRTLSDRYVKDVETFPKLTKFITDLKNEIERTENRIESGDMGYSEKQSYLDQVQRGKEYFTRMVNQVNYLKHEMGLINMAREKYSTMKVKMEGLIDAKQAKVRESLVKIKEAEMTRDLGVIVEASNYFVQLDEELKDIDELNSEALSVIDAAFDAVDETMQNQPAIGEYQSSEKFRDDLYEKKMIEFEDLISDDFPR